MRLRKKMAKMKKLSYYDNFKMGEEEKNNFNQKAKMMLSEELAVGGQVSDKLTEVFEEFYRFIPISFDYNVERNPDDSWRGTAYGEGVVDNYDSVAINIEEQVESNETGSVEIPVSFYDDDSMTLEETPYFIKIEWKKLSNGRYKLSAAVQ